MNKELLKKMQWLADKGFKPDAGYCEAHKPTGHMLTFDPPFGLPWFSESYLWVLLPDNLHEDLYEFGINKSGIGYLPGEGRSGRLMRWKTFNNLHSALLDLVIWCVKEGYLKGEL
jgi:hypothetical protein